MLGLVTGCSPTVPQVDVGYPKEETPEQLTYEEYIEDRDETSRKRWDILNRLEEEKKEREGREKNPGTYCKIKCFTPGEICSFKDTVEEEQACHRKHEECLYRCTHNLK